MDRIKQLMGDLKNEKKCVINNYKIFTISFKFSFGVPIQRMLLFNFIVPDSIITGVSFHNQYKGIYKQKKDKVEKKRKYFFNQMGININVGDKIVNCKIFKNGSSDITGCLHTDHANKAIEILSTLINQLNDVMRIKYNNLQKINSDTKLILISINNIVCIKPPEIKLINSIFKCDFNINRNIFLNVLKEYNMDMNNISNNALKIIFRYKQTEQNQYGICKCNTQNKCTCFINYECYCQHVTKCICECTCPCKYKTKKKCRKNCNICVCNKSTICVYSTGNISILATNSYQETEFVYNSLKYLIEKHFKNILDIPISELKQYL